MNDQSQMMNQAQMMGLSQGPVMKQAQMMSQGPMMNQPQIMSQPPMMSQMAQSSQPQLLSQSQAMAVQQQQQPQLMMMSSQSQPPMMNRGYKVWPQQQQKQSLDPNMKFQNSMKPNFGASSKLGRNNWKGKKGTDKRQDPRRMENPIPNASMSGPTSSGGYKPPTLHELQSQNRLKARKFYPKKKFNNRFAPYAPRNTTSFIIRAKKSGGIASLVSPCPVTPAVLPTPIFSPSREVLGDMAKEEWGVDGYGSMKGLIRLRSPGNEDEEDEEGGGGSSESDVEEHVEVERRLDHDLSRFEMIYPNYTGVEYNNVLENRVDDQDTHIAQLEEENLTLKERLFLMERDMADMRRRLQFLERQNHIVQDVNEEVVENESENESEGGSGAPDMFVVSGNRGSRSDDGHTMKENNGDDALEIERRDVCMDDLVHHEEVSKEKDVKHEEEKTRKEDECDKGLTRKENERDKGFVGKEENKGDEAKTEPIFDETMVGKEETKGDEAKTELILDDSNEEEAKMEIVKCEERAEQKEEMGISCSEKRGD